MNWKDIFPWHLDQASASDELIATVLREWRNKQLLQSDWTQLPDIYPGRVDVEGWMRYRQELRDMLKQNDDPKLIVLPEPPK